jgi:hypothetical protein
MMAADAIVATGPQAAKRDSRANRDLRPAEAEKPRPVRSCRRCSPTGKLCR